MKYLEFVPALVFAACNDHGQRDDASLDALIDDAATQDADSGNGCACPPDTYLKAGGGGCFPFPPCDGTTGCECLRTYCGLPTNQCSELSPGCYFVQCR
jgi:hypothetical protein